MEPGAGGSGVEAECWRPLVDVLQGFLVTLLALSISLWGSQKHHAEGKTGKFSAVLAGAFAPLVDLTYILASSCKCGALLWSCQRFQDTRLRFMSTSWLKIFCSALVPWSRSPARILASCAVVVYLPKHSELLKSRFTWLWSDVNVEDVSEAVVIGGDSAREFRGENFTKETLSIDGISAVVVAEMLRKDEELMFLPKYDVLKFLRGNSGFAVVAIAIQAIGYIYAVVFRSAKDLRVAPIEVVGLIFNIILLIKASLYSTCNPCHRPLVIYMNQERERRFLDVLDLKHGKDGFTVHSTDKLAFSILIAIVVCLNIPLLYYIVSLKKATNIMIVMPLMIFLVGICVDFFAISINVVLDDCDEITKFVYVVAVVVNAVAYIGAIVVTVVYWKSEQFNTRPELVSLSQLIPFIG